MKLSLSAVLIVAGTGWTQALKGNNNVVAYWGMNAGQGEQKPLGHFCDNKDNVDIFIIAGIHNFQTPSLDLASLSGCEHGKKIPGSKFVKCTALERDIKNCQKKGKKIVMSIGGPKGKYGFKSNSQAKDFADTMWDTFGGGDGKVRPFGNVIVDGFDLNIQTGSKTGYEAFSKRIKELMSKRQLLSASVGAKYPDKYIGDALKNIRFDVVMVREYTKPNYKAKKKTKRELPNMAEWADVADRVMLNVPGSPIAAKTGYNPADALLPVVRNLQNTLPRFAGIAIWDINAAEENNDFASAMKNGMFSPLSFGVVPQSGIRQPPVLNGSSFLVRATHPPITTTIARTYHSQTPFTRSMQSSRPSGMATSTYRTHAPLPPATSYQGTTRHLSYLPIMPASARRYYANSTLP